MNRKCIVVDLDDTLWKGTIGEVGRAGIEPFVEFQRLLKTLKERGVILAACSKNDEDTALAAFTRSDMVLKREDFAAFVANWNDKARNIRQIASTLNIGLESIVFLDDSAFERGRVRHALPMVAVPEDGEQIIERLFSAEAITEEDRNRTAFYHTNERREELRQASPSIEEYLQSLDMKLTWTYFLARNLPRIHQLINKTNQFNLTTRRYSEKELETLVTSSTSFGLQFRLTDIFGDNGMIAVIIASGERDLEIDTWLMSCRVIGRQIERQMFEAFLGEAKRRGARRIIGQYLPTSRNGIVRDHYQKLGFTAIGDHWEFKVEAT